MMRGVLRKERGGRGVSPRLGMRPRPGHASHTRLLSRPAHATATSRPGPRSQDCREDAFSHAFCQTLPSDSSATNTALSHRGALSLNPRYTFLMVVSS